MDAQQFRLGNITENGIVHQIGYKSGILGAYFLNTPFDSSGGMFRPQKEIYPVSINEERLLEFKWQLIKGIDFCINSDFKIDKYGHLYYHNDYTGINVIYIHQLQNLYFSLVGKELELNTSNNEQPKI